MSFTTQPLGADSNVHASRVDDPTARRPGQYGRLPHTSATSKAATATTPFLRNILLFDVATCVGMGLLLLIANEQLRSLFNLPTSLLTGAGIALLPIGAFAALVATRKKLSRAGVIVMIVGNAGWALASVALVFTPWVKPNALGLAFVIAQAIVVAILAELEFIGLRKAA
ncbi:hypothetical protein BH09PSE5_BH09PSE5_31150 [soil metagenome]